MTRLSRCRSLHLLFHRLGGVAHLLLKYLRLGFELLHDFVVVQFASDFSPNLIKAAAKTVSPRQYGTNGAR